MKSDIIFGRNPVLEAIRAGREIDKIYIKNTEADGSLKKVLGAAKSAKIVVSRVDKKKLDMLCDGENHQGVVAAVAEHSYCTVEDILKNAEEKGEKPFVVICDKISDPHNLGSIIRTANAAGAHGVIIPKHESAGLNATVAKVSAGAVEFTPVARVNNLASVIEKLKKEGFWVTGAAMGGDKSLFEADLDGSVAIVIGSEGNGISRGVLEKCDFVVSIPMKGETESLNASVAAALLMYEVMRRRN